MKLGDKVWVYSNGSYYEGAVSAVGPKRVGLVFTTGSGKVCVKSARPDATVSGYRIVLPFSSEKPKGARAGGKPNAYADRVRRYEREGLCTSDAQAAADVDGGPQE